jgi:hypothetical protein
MCKALAYILDVRNIRAPDQKKTRRRQDGVRGEVQGAATRYGNFRR